MGYLLLPLTLLADVAGGYLSYVYGAWILPWLWAALAQSAGPGLLYAITWPLAAWVHRVPPTWPPTFAPSPLLGQIWLGLFVAVHVFYAIKHLIWRYNTTHRGIPQAGNPGEDKWELVQRRYHDYEEALARFREPITLIMPNTWRYTTEPGAPLVELRGRLLLIHEQALHARAVRLLAPELARALGKRNSHDWLFRDVLDYYPPKWDSSFLLLGIGIWLPMLVKGALWPLWHWRKRTLVYDQLAWMCGQGQLLYDELAALPREPRSFFSPLPLLSQRLGQLEALIRTEHQWMQQHHLIEPDVELLILHGHTAPAQMQLSEGRSK